uniref:Uncharacterized protein n=1 Tax=Meloidogyne javanica TaxID=6303 RepID=A0A915N2T5_MELJA
MVAVVLHNSGNDPQFLYSFNGRINGSSTGCCKADGERDFIFSSINLYWNSLKVCGNKMVWNRYERRHSTWRNNEVFRLNVGGKSFCFRPDTARLVRLEHHQRLMLTDGFQHGEYYLERNSKVAEHVLDYFLTGKLHKPPEICPQRFSEELLFWRLILALLILTMLCWEREKATVLESPTSQVFIYRPTDNPQRWLVILENCCIAWFTMDFLLRLLVAPRRWLFLRQPLNLIDLFTVLPFYCELALSQMGVSNTEGVWCNFENFIEGTLYVINVFALWNDFLLYANVRGITVTTVGYGDCQILSWVGKLIAGLSSVFGIIILAFPISMVVENFAVAQQKLKLENQLKEVQMSQVANDYLMRRYPSRRKACRDPLDGSLHRHQQQPQNINQKIPSSPPLTDLSSNVLNAPYSALSENFVLATN